MPTTILIVCPECGKQIKAPDTVLGKRVRCKFCQAAFVASQEAGKPAKPVAGKPAKSPSAKPAASKPNKPPVDDEDDQSLYGVTDTELAYRCPECANEMESEDAVVCLICGYNTLTRERIKTRKVQGNTTGEQVVWLLPGIACVLAIITVLIFNIWYLMKIHDLVGNEDSWYLSMWDHHGIKFWVVLISLFILYFTGKFAFKRLILHHAPPEIEKPK